MRAVPRLVFAALLLAAAAEAARVFVGRNFHEVVPGRVYRCAQPSPEALEAMVKAHGIRTVINLRGCATPLSWYLDEGRATAALDLSQEDVSFSVYHLPPRHELLRLIDALDHSDPPILLHCRQGADRTGLASGVALLLQPGSTLNRSRRQLGIRYGHLPVGAAACLDRFFDLYSHWLAEQRLSHSPPTFRRWAEDAYHPEEASARLELLENPSPVPCGEPSALRVRCHNQGPGKWRLRPDGNVGVHAGFQLFDDRGNGLGNAKAGLFDAEVPPGGFIDLTLVIPALNTPGRYRALIDMVDEQKGWFFQTGSEPLEAELEARAKTPPARR